MNDIIGTIKLVLSEPTTCWSKLSKKTVNDALLYLVVIMAAYGVLAVLMMTLWAGPLGAGIGIVGVLGSLVFGLVMSLVAAWLYNVIIALVIEIVIFGVLSMILMMVFGAAFMGMLFAAGQA